MSDVTTPAQPTVHAEHGGDHHEPQGPLYLQHHFSDSEQQMEAAKLGMWLFLLTEILIFGGLFGYYAFYRAWHPEMFHEAHKLLDVRMGALNTVVLITSSVTMALAIRSTQMNKRKQTAIFLVATILLAATFLVVKYFEYSHKFHEGTLPGKYYTSTEVDAVNPHIFFSIYFAMTGLHALHILGGMSLISWTLFRTLQGVYSSQYYTPLEMTGLYWHLVDLIWIYLFPLLYLIG
jgi:cytochrome c oxidase subunit 3